MNDNNLMGAIIIGIMTVFSLSMTIFNKRYVFGMAKKIIKNFKYEDMNLAKWRILVVIFQCIYFILFLFFLSLFIKRYIL